MAKTSKINKQLQREQIVAKYAQRRAQCKRDSVNPHLTADERAEAMRRLHAIPRDASPTRLRNRDSIDGRPRAFNRKFGLSRINLGKGAPRGASRRGEEQLVIQRGAPTSHHQKGIII